MNMSFLQAIILGVVEGITEFLPISSTGHLILSGRILGLAETEFLKSFNIAIQSGAILAVLVLYGRTLIRDSRLIKRVLTAFVPTAVIGFIFYKLIKKFLLGNPLVVVVALFLGGIVIVVFEKMYQRRPHSPDPAGGITYSQAFLIGVFQSLAVVPGVSRSAATILGGLSLGLPRRTIVEFSFLLAVPTMLAATGYDLIKSAPAFSLNEAGLLSAGFLVSFAVAVVSIKFLLYFIKRFSFELFGYYRIAIALLFFIFYH